MKKQLLIAAVAATMTSVAMADISITGDAKVNYTNVDSATETLDRNEIAHDINLHLKGSNGDTTVVVDFATAQTVGANTLGASAFDVENAYVTSKIGDITIKMGQWNNTSDSLISNASNATIGSGKVTLSTTLAGVAVSFSDNEDGRNNVVLAGTVSGVAISHKIGSNGNADYTDTKVSGSVAGVNATCRVKAIDGANNDMDSLEISGVTNGITLTYAQAEVEGTGSGMGGEGYLGTASSLHSISGFGASMSLAGNKVTVKSITANTGTSAAKVEDDYTKFVVTRALASGATFEATYTDKDAAAGSTSDSTTLDLELAVSF